MAIQVPAFLAPLRDQILADKKKSAVMGVLLLVLLGSLARFIIGGDDAALPVTTPAVATASPSMAPIEQPIVQAAPAVATPAAQVATPAAVVVAAPVGPRVEVEQMPRSLNRDLFNSAALNTFASDPGAAGEDGKPRRSEFWDSILNKVAERQKSLAHERKAMADEMATLRLQCTLTGACPLAYISGRLVRVGDEVRGFSVVRIDERSVLLRKSIFTRPLAMP